MRCGVPILGLRLSGPVCMALVCMALDSRASAEAVDIGLGGGLTAATTSKDYTFRLGGRMQLDASFFDNDKAEFGNGTRARRVQLAISGVIERDWYYKIEYGLNDQRLKYTYLRYLGFNTLTPQVGQLNHAFGLEDITSSNAITFMERGLPNVFAPGLGVGFGINYAVPAWTGMICLLGDEIDDTKTEDEEVGLSARVVYRPLYDEKSRLLHFAVATAWIDPDDGKEQQFRSRPEAALNDVFLVDTDVMSGIDRTALTGFEHALVWGPWSLQGEWMQARLKGETPADFSGWYAYTSYFITGESRPYTISDGEFTNVVPAGSGGAWELALRFSHLDLDSGLVHGGEEDNTTVAVNWYATKFIRFAANVIQVRSMRQGITDNPNIIEFRTQLVF